MSYFSNSTIDEQKMRSTFIHDCERYKVDSPDVPLPRQAQKPAWRLNANTKS